MFKPSTLLSQQPMPPGDPALPGADGLTDRRTLASLVAAFPVGKDLPRFYPSNARALVYETIRYKVGVKLTVTVRVEHDQGLERFTFQALSPAAAEEMRSKLEARDLPPAGWLHFAEGAIVGFRWPLDRELPGLALVTSGQAGAARVRRLLPEFAGADQRLRSNSFRVTPVRYKPERHAVMFLDFALRHGPGRRTPGRLVLRVQPPGTRGPIPDDDLRGLVPTPVASDGHLGLFLEEFVAGEPLQERMDRPGPQAMEAIRAAGTTLARFHHSPGDPGGGRRTLEERIAGYRLEFEEATRLISARAPEALPGWKARTDEVLQRLAELPSGPTVRLHGDPHPGQFLVTDRGAVLLDLEKSLFGPAAADLGMMLAGLDFHLQQVSGGPVLTSMQVRDAFLKGYGEWASTTCPIADLLVWKEVARLQRVPAPLRNLHPEVNPGGEGLVVSTDDLQYHE